MDLTNEEITRIFQSLPIKPILTVADVAQFMEVPLSTTYKACKEGQIPCARLRRNIRISYPVFQRWYLEQVTGAAASHG